MIDKLGIVEGNSLEVLREYDPETFDSVVTDPPYELGFMGNQWDRSGIANSVDLWSEVLRVLKPGGHLLSFSGTRTYHRMTCAIEDAGFEIRDCLMWLYGSGMPKGLNIGKAIDKMERGFPQGGPDPLSPYHGQYRSQRTEGKRSESDSGQGYGAGSRFLLGDNTGRRVIHAESSWNGWNTALKPSWEPIVMARKPLSGTVAANTLQYGTGGLNIDATRIESDGRLHREIDPKTSANGAVYAGRRRGSKAIGTTSQGRWPANVTLSHNDDCKVVGKKTLKGRVINRWDDGAKPFGNGAGHEFSTEQFDDEVLDIWECSDGCAIALLDESSAGASRFFYCSKTSPKERAAGVEKNDHPTVKPIDLMRWLVRMVTPPQGYVLDPFLGSGSTGCACVLEGFNFLGIDLDAHYCEIAESRILHWYNQMESREGLSI